MRPIIVKTLLSVLLSFLSLTANAQTEDLRQVTGLPIPIGAAAIYGRVEIKGLRPDEKRPLIFVSFIVGGSQVDRKQTNDDGYYYFLTTPRDGSTLVFEANGSEIGRIVLTGGVGSSVRQDISVNWQEVLRSGSAPGVISIKNEYIRSNDANKVFDAAMAAARDKKTEIAIKLFEDIVKRDVMDFVAWTELGTLYFGNNKLSQAESSYTKALELRPDFMIALMNLGKLQLAEKQFDKAIMSFTRAARADLKSADAFHYLGESYLQAKQGSKAEIALNEAIRLAPIEKAELHLRLAALYNAAGIKNRAANEYKLFLAKKPDYPEKDKLEKFIKEFGKD